MEGNTTYTDNKNRQSQLTDHSLVVPEKSQPGTARSNPDLPDLRLQAVVERTSTG